MKSVFVILAIMLFDLPQSGYGQSVHKVNRMKPDTTQKSLFKMSKGCTVRVSGGALQGTNHSMDSTGYLAFADVFCKTSYELILLYKSVIERKALGYDSTFTVFDNKVYLVLPSSSGHDSGFVALYNEGVYGDSLSDFACYAFVYPHRDPETQPDIHAMNIDFPVVVSGYKRINGDTWQYIATTKAKTFEKFSEFQFRVIYNLINDR